MAPWLSIIGVTEAGPKALQMDAVAAIARSSLVVAAPRFHNDLADMVEKNASIIAFPSPLRNVYPVLHAAAHGHVTVLATGDPLWFGIGASLVAEFGADACAIIPNVSGLQLAAAQMGWPLAATEIVSIHGRAPETILRHLYPRARLLVIGEDADSPAKAAALLCECGYGAAVITILSHLGNDRGGRFVTIAQNLHEGIYDDQPEIQDFHIMAIACPDHHPHTGGPAMLDKDIENDGKLTKADLRASAITKLNPFSGAIIWDLGAGSGAVAIDFMRRAPRTRGFAIDRDDRQIDMARRNAAKFGVPSLQHIKADLPDGLAGLPVPDAVFLGGGICDEVIACAVAQLRGGGALLAHAVTVESEMLLVASWRKYGGNLTRIAVNHANPVGGYHGWRPLMPVTQWHFIKPDNAPKIGHAPTIDDKGE